MKTWQRRWIKECLLLIKQEKDMNGLRKIYEKIMIILQKGPNCFTREKIGDNQFLNSMKKLIDVAFNIRFPGMFFSTNPNVILTTSKCNISIFLLSKNSP